MTEGYVKFLFNWEKEEIEIPDEIFQSLDNERLRLFSRGLIGMYPDGVGYGNISVRTKGGAFIITGSATGQYASLERKHYAVVSGYSFEGNSITCTGMTKASAESLTHAAVYEALPEVGAVVHAHCLNLWQKLLNNLPTTSTEIEYGTPEMALAVRSLVSEISAGCPNIIVMGGHREGILTFGKNIEEATNQIITIFNQYNHD